LATLVIGISAVHAETGLEQRLLHDPAPHTLAAKTGTKVIAHYATINGFLDGQPRNAERLVELKNAVNFCMKNPNPLALPLQPPTEWPDLLNGHRIHMYTTERYSISYRRDWTYGPTMPNCSVLEGSGYTAILQSSAGQCQMDLIEKKAWGQCNMAAHRAAKPLTPMLPPPGPLQVIAGLRCGVSKVFNTEMCLAVDGKMKPSYPLIVSMWSDYGLHEKAVTAALDIEVSESIFAPHLQAGFTVTDKRP
jgi:hypothetical protein